MPNRHPKTPPPNSLTLDQGPPESVCIAPPASNPDLYYYDADAAERACNFFPACLQHIEGPLGGQPFELADWQKIRIVRPAFGWKRKDNHRRRFRTVYLEVPRGNGKTTLIVGFGYLLLLADREPGAQVCSAAADRNQAGISFRLATEMRLRSPALAKRTEAYASAITVPSTASSWRCLSGEAYNKHGLNLHGILLDELHAHPTRDLYDVLTTSQVKRTQPLTVIITTAGYDRASICWEVHDRAAKVLAGTIHEDTLLPIIYAAPEEADWTSPEVWKAANPGYGVSVMPEFLETKSAIAQQSPREENIFRQLHLNQWTEQQTRWLPMARWRGCAGPVDLATLAGRPCFAGLDLASTTDLAAFVLVFPPLEQELAASPDAPYRVYPRFWLPAENVRDRENRDRANYLAWIREGHITPTPGNEIDDAQIAAEILALCRPFDIREIAYDRWGARLLRRELQDAGLNIVEFGQGFRDMSPGAKDLEKLVLTGRLAHAGNPVLQWMAEAAAVIRDPAGNIKPAKDKSSSRIDGIVALIMALARAMLAPNAASVYEKRGITLL